MIPFLCSFLEIVLAIVDFPEPERPVNQRQTPFWFKSFSLSSLEINSCFEENKFSMTNYFENQIYQLCQVIYDFTMIH